MIFFNNFVLISGIPEGGLVPKSLYMTPQEFEKDQSPGPHLMDNSCYQSIALTKGQVKFNTNKIVGKLLLDTNFGLNCIREMKGI